MQEVSKNPLSISPEREQSAISRKAKRKRTDGKGYDPEAVVVNSGKRRKSKTSKVNRSSEENNLELDQGLNMTIAKLDSRLLADYVANRTKRFLPYLSIVELEEMYISGKFDESPLRQQ